ncbi:MAG: aspartyl-phosphate phosphatase Spo0E family protein [Clostridia bacterium]|nr:aspartyl-phosphate phosphatase Spo0E family protein [Clostridia bacterium]
MSQLECLREKLYKVIETGDTEYILKISQELDELILNYMETQVNTSRKSA